MPRCKKCECYYTGKENNPKGLGWCAAHDEEGKRRKGRDEHWYKSVNGRWKKSKSSWKMTSPRLLLALNGTNYLYVNPGHNLPPFFFNILSKTIYVRDRESFQDLFPFEVVGYNNNPNTEYEFTEDDVGEYEQAFDYLKKLINMTYNRSVIHDFFRVKIDDKLFTDMKELYKENYDL